MVPPLKLFRSVAVAEAITWALLLTGMFLKYVTETTELGVRIFGMLHGVVFIAYCLTVLLMAVDQRWRAGRTALGLAASIPPFFTLWFERSVEHREGIGQGWRLTEQEPVGVVETICAWLLRKPFLGAAIGLVAVAILTTLALVIGPPAS